MRTSTWKRNLASPYRRLNPFMLPLLPFSAILLGVGKKTVVLKKPNRTDGFF
ncbi:hypothetical protein WN944_029553 [Citrus x changshan-huyou]|uniref:Uncharacterized protein n=1 Tax=Citrus x changshan-huyou TaxID=2935761 RepID=A0AAP0QAF7_9ROSI